MEFMCVGVCYVCEGEAERRISALTNVSVCVSVWGDSRQRDPPGKS